MPRVETVNYTVYKIDELSKEAQEKAFSKWCEGDYPWGTENEDTLKAFERAFPVKVYDWEYGYRNYANIRMECDDGVEELSGHRLATYIWNNHFRDLFKGKYYSSKIVYNDGKPSYKHRYSRVIFEGEGHCVLTGYGIDIDILKPIYEFLKKPYDITFKMLMQKCVDNWIKACDDDYQSYYSMDTFLESARDNEWEYLVDGRQF